MAPAKRSLLIIGAGPAGLTAACEAQAAGWQVTVLERDPEYVGGISRTVRHRGYRFDIGGHRFFSKNPEITSWWKRRLPNDFIQVKRMSRIFYRGRYFDYPLKPWNALSNLGVFSSIACVSSYIWARMFPIKPERSFEDWVCNRFGRLLFTIFFKTYTEKVWGISTSKLSADWAAQRIKGLSLSKAVINAFRGSQAGSGAVVKTLVDSFEYPRLGPGQMWEKAAADILQGKGKIGMGLQASRIQHKDGRVISVETVGVGGARVSHTADQFIVSMPLQETALAFDPPLPESAVLAAKSLEYRDFITVALVLRGKNPFPDNWIYIHEPALKLGRIQNFRNWSEAMIPDEGTICLGLEYFCFKGDGLWTSTDKQLIELATRELIQLGMASSESVVMGAVVKMEKAYPVYSPGYQSNIDAVRLALAPFSNLQVVGRNGMHKYNNQDHSMMTAILAVRNLGGEAFNLWNVNTDAEYHEDAGGSAGGRKDDLSGRLTPRTL